jgi:hypothetical protein
MDSRDFWVYFQRFFLGASIFKIFYTAKNRVSGSAGLYFFSMYLPLLAVAGTIGQLIFLAKQYRQMKMTGKWQFRVLTKKI